jgi:hypothetical protein
MGSEQLELGCKAVDPYSPRRKCCVVDVDGGYMFRNHQRHKTDKNLPVALQKPWLSLIFTCSYSSVKGTADAPEGGEPVCVVQL